MNYLNSAYNSTFCLAHWIFSMMYWSSSLRLPYVYKGQSAPPYMKIVILAFFWVFAVLNLIVPAIIGFVPPGSREENIH